MASGESNAPPNDGPENQWKLYELLWGTLQHYHDRWVDSYRVFLSFNAFLLPAVTALLGFSFRENSEALRPFVSLLCGIGVWSTWQGIGLLKRIRIDTDLRLNQLTRLEDKMVDMPVRPFKEGKNFFFHNKDVEGFLQHQHRDKGRRAIDAYINSSWAINGYYLIVGVYALFPWFSSVCAK